MIPWTELRKDLFPIGLKKMDIEIDIDRIHKEEAYWWISKIMAAYYALNTPIGDLDSGLL